ncbi:hypothetical protein [Microvirga flavescens]|uniref:hypothetical protein n=1 Tax=Microvirga flavescens TaxID=2249811 RepID=UPI000DD62755|nr:hypothetical protein [Microvirga flavescens]
MIKKVAVACGLWAASAILGTASADCSGGSVFITSARAQVEGELTVKAGTGCSFNLNNIPGAVNETKIVQQPKFGRAGVSNLTPFYAAKAGYSGADEFAYAFIGMDQYGGPMNVQIKWKVTVVP